VCVFCLCSNEKQRLKWFEVCYLEELLLFIFYFLNTFIQTFEKAIKELGEKSFIKQNLRL